MAISQETREQVEKASTLDRGSLEKLENQLTGEYQRSRSQAVTPGLVAELTELAGAIETVSSELRARKSHELDETVAALDQQVAGAVQDATADAPTLPVVPAPTDLHEQLAALDNRVATTSDATLPSAQTGTPPSAPTQGRSWLQRLRPSGEPGGSGAGARTPLFWGGIAAAVLGVILVVLGIVIGFSSASSDRSSADQAKAATQNSQAQEQQASAARDAITTASSELHTEMNSLVDAGNQLTDASGKITDAFNHATDLSNAGNSAGAVAAYQAQNAAIADLDQKLKAVQNQLAKAQQSLGALQTQRGQ